MKIKFKLSSLIKKKCASIYESISILYDDLKKPLYHGGPRNAPLNLVIVLIISFGMVWFFFEVIVDFLYGLYHGWYDKQIREVCFVLGKIKKLIIDFIEWLFPRYPTTDSSFFWLFADNSNQLHSVLRANYFELTFFFLILFLILIKTTIISKTLNLFQVETGLYLICVLVLYIFFQYNLDLYLVSHNIGSFFIYTYSSSIFYLNFVFFYIIFLIFCLDYCIQLKLNSNEIFFLLFFFLIFIKLLFSCIDLFAIYLCLEGLTYTIYILVLLLTTNNLEISEHKHKVIFIKYFIFNSVSSLCILFSIACLFACAGSLNINFLFSFFMVIKYTEHSVLILLITILFFLGFFFKLLLFPFFFWAKEFYENMPNLLFILLNTFYKLSVFIIFIKLVIKFAFYAESIIPYQIFFIFGLLTFFAGLFGALFTSKIRTFLFYTSVNQIGLIFIALGQLTYIPQVSLVIAIFYYLCIYLITLFFFLILLSFGKITGVQYKNVEYFNEFQNLGNTHTFISIILSVFLFSFSGIPPFIGFFAKYELFMQLFNINPLISVLCIVGSLISAFYYISLIISLFFSKTDILLKSNPIKTKFIYFNINKFGFLYFFLTFIALIITFNFLIPGQEYVFKYLLSEFIFWF